MTDAPRSTPRAGCASCGKPKDEHVQEGDDLYCYPMNKAMHSLSRVARTNMLAATFVPPASAPAATPEPTKRLWCTKCQAHYDGEPPKYWCPRCDGERLPANSRPAPVHNHGPEDGPGLSCRERRIDGRLVGDCVRPAAPTGEEADDAANLAGLITMCRDLKARLVPFGASESGWDSAIATLERATAQATALAALRARVEEIANDLAECHEVITPQQVAVLSANLRAALAPRQPEERQP